jgi:hypothetical protein
VPIHDGYVLVREAAALTGNAINTIYQWVRKDLLPHVKHHGHTYVQLDAVSQCRQRQRTSTKIPPPPPQGMITTRRAHDITSVPMRTIQHLANTNRITATKYQGRWYVSLDDLISETTTSAE